MKTFVVTGRDSKNHFFKEYIEAPDVEYAKEIFESRCSDIGVRVVCVELYKENVTESEWRKLFR